MQSWTGRPRLIQKTFVLKKNLITKITFKIFVGGNVRHGSVEMTYFKYIYSGRKIQGIEENSYILPLDVKIKYYKKHLLKGKEGFVSCSLRAGSSNFTSDLYFYKERYCFSSAHYFFPLFVLFFSYFQLS